MKTVSVLLRGLDKELDIKKVAEVKLQHTDKEFIYLEKMDDGWRLTYTERTVHDIQKLEALEIIRRDDFAKFSKNCSHQHIGHCMRITSHNECSEDVCPLRRKS